MKEEEYVYAFSNDLIRLWWWEGYFYGYAAYSYEKAMEIYIELKTRGVPRKCEWETNVRSYDGVDGISKFLEKWKTYLDNPPSLREEKDDASDNADKYSVAVAEGLVNLGGGPMFWHPYF
ncbi:hypothetical protein KY333_06035 [Candidatus Woesearchaeota archaeon]|nr:hypothetical protein [Candidatus Woesearchaeota archaeon]